MSMDVMHIKAGSRRLTVARDKLLYSVTYYGTYQIWLCARAEIACERRRISGCHLVPYSLRGALEFHSIMESDWPRRNKSHYVTEIVSWLGFADVIFRRNQVTAKNTSAFAG